MKLKEVLGFVFLIFILFNFVAGDDYVAYNDVGMEYKLHKTLLVWPHARMVCKDEGAELAMPANQKEADIIKSIFNSHPLSQMRDARKKDRIILGFHDLFEEGEYLVENGNTLQYSYHVWEKGQPDSRRNNENCGSMSRDGYIDDFPCHVPSIFICQKETTEKLVKVNDDCKTHDLAYKYSKTTRHCYKLHIQPRKWSAARAICKAEGAQLAVINSQEEEEVLLDMINDPDNHLIYPQERCCTLIGFHDLFHGGQYLTINGDLLESSGFIKWSRGNPSHSKYKNCGSLDKNGGLKDISCDLIAPFICERSTDLMVDVRIQE